MVTSLLSLVSYSCGIDLGDYFVVTGGYNGLDKVAQYSETGFDKYLANLNEGRDRHACTKFVDQSGNTVRYFFKFRTVYISYIVGSSGYRRKWRNIFYRDLLGIDIELVLCCPPSSKQKCIFSSNSG